MAATLGLTPSSTSAKSARCNTAVPAHPSRGRRYVERFLLMAPLSTARGCQPRATRLRAVLLLLSHPSTATQAAASWTPNNGRQSWWLSSAGLTRVQMVSSARALLRDGSTTQTQRLGFVNPRPCKIPPSSWQCLLANLPLQSPLFAGGLPGDSAPISPAFPLGPSCTALAWRFGGFFFRVALESGRRSTTLFLSGFLFRRCTKATAF